MRKLNRLYEKVCKEKSDSDYTDEEIALEEEEMAAAQAAKAAQRKKPRSN